MINVIMGIAACNKIILDDCYSSFAFLRFLTASDLVDVPAPAEGMAYDNQTTSKATMLH
jgi:hypothetical protein